MSPTEGIRRLRDIAVKQSWRPNQVSVGQVDSLKVPSQAPAFETPIRQALAEMPDEARESLLKVADALLTGRWSVFGVTRTDMIPVPDWFLDPQTKRRAPNTNFCFDIPYRDEQIVGNIKSVWELSRHHHLTLLASAYFLTGNDRYAETIATHLQSWWQENPYLSGVHWTSGIELGLRLIAWVWIRRLLDKWDGVSELFEGNRFFLQQLYRHQHYLARLESHGSSANNHLLAEAAGRFAAASAFPYFPESAIWREHAARTLDRNIQHQTFRCGLNRELATDYHLFVLEFCLAAALEGEASGHPLSIETWETLRRMTDGLAAIVDAKGNPPQQGDGDDGKGLLLDAPDRNRSASLLATGAALFGPCDWWPELHQSDLRTAFLTALAPVPAISGPRPQSRPAEFPGAGMAILRDGAADREIWCRVDHGPLGYLSIAAHGHADALSLELRVGGQIVLADPGTYCYHGEPEWRRYFRSTRGHNTLEVDGQDQSEFGGPFMWTTEARARLLHFEGHDADSMAEWSAEHDGYERLNPPVRHRRTVRLNRLSKELVIEDRVECRGRHDYRLAFHLGPNIGCVLTGNVARLSWDEAGKDRHATLSLPPSLLWCSINGQVRPPTGWYSSDFGIKCPATTLIGRVTTNGDCCMRTELQMEFQNNLARARTPEIDRVGMADY